MAGKSKQAKYSPAFEDIIDKASHGDIAPVYLIYGNEEFLIKKNIKLLSDAIIPEVERDFNIEFIDGTVISPEDIITTCNTYPFLGSKKIIIVQNYPALSPIKISIKTILNLFKEGNKKNSVEELLSYLDITMSDLQNMTKFELKEKIEKKEKNDSIEDQDLAVLDQLYIYIIEKTDTPLSSSKEEDHDKDLLEDFIGNKQSNFTYLIFVQIGEVRKKSLYKLIIKQGIEKEFAVVENNPDDIKKILKLKGIKISSGALKKLTEKAGLNLTRINQEIEKIIAFLGEKKDIDEKDIELLVSRSETEKIYELSDAIAERKKDKALEILHNLFKDEIFPLQIMSVIISRFRLLIQSKLLVEDDSLSRKKIEELLPSDKSHNILKQHPFVISKVNQQSRTFSICELKSCYKKLLEIDKQLKLSAGSKKYY
ncbi:hypothetical protein HY745_02955 [Candidatus Desantisbacteria bacterium]|nr:hypothetical protein [Candidatus Desantisbacteria bacterium]